ncbi:MAG: hypothetical protein ABI643_02880 [Candidatus Doudnabacteria bacterium]
MARKINSKNKKINRISKLRKKQYPTFQLAVVLAAVLILEGALFLSSNRADWQKAVGVLDMSGEISVTVQNMSLAFQPMIETAQDVNMFYQEATTQMMQLLDLDGTGVGSEFVYIYNGVYDFYQQSSGQLAAIFDVSNSLPFFPAAGTPNSR